MLQGSLGAWPGSRGRRGGGGGAPAQGQPLPRSRTVNHSINNIKVSLCRPLPFGVLSASPIPVLFDERRGTKPGKDTEPAGSGVQNRA